MIALACAAQGILMLVSARTQGTLELECRGRCRFQGGECLPGGSVSMALDPGSYSVEVWTPQTEPPWTGRPVTIRVGEVTRFDCLP